MFADTAFLGALLAGSLIALACGILGWFVVQRGQVFAGDALSHVAFTGALAAAAAAIDLRAGILAATLLVALSIAAAGAHGGGDDVAIGVVLTGVLGLGVLFLHLASTGSIAGNSTIAALTLFGSLYSLSGAEALSAALLAGAVVLGALAIMRPLLFASLQGDLALSSGVPARLLGVAFLLLLAITAAEATQAIGALLMLGLLAAPAGAAHRLARSPYVGIALSSAIAVAGMWAGLALSYALPAVPPGSAVVLVVSAIYAATLPL